MVNRSFVSYTSPEAGAWVWPVFAKSESESENLLTGLLTYLLIADIIPYFSILIAFFMWVLYRFEFLNFFRIKVLAIITGAFWFALGFVFGVGQLFSEIWHSTIWHPDVNHLTSYVSLLILRTFFITSCLFWVAIYFNRRQVHPEKVHIKVSLRQRHERMRHMRRWQKTIQLKEIL